MFSYCWTPPKKRSRLKGWRWGTQVEQTGRWWSCSMHLAIRAGKQECTPRFLSSPQPLNCNEEGRDLPALLFLFRNLQLCSDFVCKCEFIIGYTQFKKKKGNFVTKYWLFGVILDICCISVAQLRCCSTATLWFLCKEVHASVILSLSTQV